MPGDEGVPPNLVAALAQLAAAHVDLDALLELGATADVPPPPPVDADAPAARGAEQPTAAAAQQEQQQGERGRKGGAGQPRGRVRIAVARDAAFCFYYHDNLHLLRAAGADLVPFSPLVDPLPADVAGVYLGGGYPER
jgi:cobyrinic acid a,c-diamide synthase